ncbi:membrane-targeted effector domain-containing toxin [Pseudomonas sp. RIT-To-2]|uniref:membrane-targeted effector domain-containing toxin n=1 Tax=Pseudomonas sp. RIT-To-2 TaxID=3462541 RepID=UPI002413BBA5
MPQTVDTTAARDALKALAQALPPLCPDLREEARLFSQTLLEKHDHGELEPDHVWFHRWTNAQSSPRTFTGWEHVGWPYESLTFPQLIMHRFYPSDQDNADNLQQMAGFYTTGPHDGVYDEKTEVQLIPADVLKMFWDIDFKSYYSRRLDTFWDQNTDNYRTLAKANYLAKALQALDAKHLTFNEFQVVVHAVAGDIAWPVTLDTLTSEGKADTQHGLKVCAFDIGGHVATDILRIVDPDGFQYLYVPGDAVAFHVFETSRDLYWWVMNETNQAENRARFLSHFSKEAQGESKDDTRGVNHMLDLLFYGWGNHAKAVNTNEQALTQDAFTYLADAMRTRMYADAEHCLVSNAQIRKLMWVGYLDTFGKTFGGMAAVDWPVTLALVGASLADMGLNIDEAVHAHSTAERKAGVIGAILNGIDVLFNGAFLLKEAKAAAAEVRPLETAVAAARVEASLPAPLKPVPDEVMLKPFETNEILVGDTDLTVEGRMRGVQLSDEGNTCIEIDGQTYQVRYVKEMSTWVIVDPANPFSFYKNVPVRLTPEGTWSPLDPGGLKGGGKFLGKWPWGRAAMPADPVALIPEYAYEVPKADRPLLETSVKDTLLMSKLMRGDVIFGSDISVSVAIDLREKLAADAEAFFKAIEPVPRPEIPGIAPNASEKEIINQLFTKTQGIVIGEAHDCIASKKFLIDNMELLASQNVRTLYMEHLFTDFHQADLEAFGRTGTMSDDLSAYLKDQDIGQRTDRSGRYNFTALVRTAAKHHIRVQAIDCLASYFPKGIAAREFASARIKMMNFYASKVIRAEQSIRNGGNWVALVGSSHANTFEGVAGVAELEGAIGLRIQDPDPGAFRGIKVDPGANGTDAMNSRDYFVKSDLVYYGGKVDITSVAQNFEARLPNPGMFAIDSSTMDIVHRSRDGVLVRTPIIQDGANYYIQRPQWTFVHERRFDSINELAIGLRMTGLKWTP